MRNSFRWLVVIVGLLASTASPTLRAAAGPTIVVASTTSTQDSGLFGHLLPSFQRQSGISVKIVAQGTGQALDTARRGDADVVFVHDRDAEEKFVAEGYGLKRHPVMYNDFVLVGPKSDPAGIKAGKDVVQALGSIRTSRAAFISRGDRSGTHQAELRLWRAGDGEVDPAKEPWYRSVGQGMGSALNIAAATNAYILVDRATWITFANKQQLQVLLEGDRRLFNQYGVILVNPARHPHLKSGAGQQFIDYLLSPGGQRDIGAYRVQGQQLFYPCQGETLPCSQ